MTGRHRKTAITSTQRSRNWALLAVLIGFAALMYVITIVRLDAL